MLSSFTPEITYRPSGIAPFAGLLKGTFFALLATVVFAAIASTFVAEAGVLSLLAFAVPTGLVVGYVAGYALRSGHVRWPIVAPILAAVCGTIAAAWLLHGQLAGPSMPLHTVPIADSLDMIARAATQPLAGLVPNTRSAELPGAAWLALWLLAVAATITAAVWIARDALSRPYCERCGAWCVVGRPARVQFAVQSPPEQVEAGVHALDFAFLRDAAAASAMDRHQYDLSVHGCTRCMVVNMVTLGIASRTDLPPGAREETAGGIVSTSAQPAPQVQSRRRRVAVRHRWLSPEANQWLREWMDRFAREQAAAARAAAPVAQSNIPADDSGFRSRICTQAAHDPDWSAAGNIARMLGLQLVEGDPNADLRTTGEGGRVDMLRYAVLSARVAMGGTDIHVRMDGTVNGHEVTFRFDHEYQQGVVTGLSFSTSAELATRLHVAVPRFEIIRTTASHPLMPTPNPVPRLAGLPVAKFHDPTLDANFAIRADDLRVPPLVVAALRPLSRCQYVHFVCDGGAVLAVMDLNEVGLAIMYLDALMHAALTMACFLEGAPPPPPIEP